MLKKLREPVNSLTHWGGAVLALIGLIALLIVGWSTPAKVISLVVYGISLFAIGRAPIWKQRAAHWLAALLLIFGLGVAADALRRFITGSEPIGLTMMAMAAIAAVVNLVCFFLLRRLKSDDVNLEAAETFSLNDFASNGGVLVAGALVLWLDQRWPDLLVGALVALIAIKGSIDIWRSARRDQAGEQTER